MSTEFSFQSYDKLALFGQYWLPPQTSKAIILLVHGIGEHSSRYTHLASAFNQAQIGVIAFDQRGHGRSAGPRGHTPSETAWLLDIANFISTAKEIINKKGLGDQKYFLYGHSLGGLEVLDYLLKFQPKLTGAIVTSPALELAFKPSALKVILGKVANLIFPTICLHNELEIKYLTHDAKIIEAYKTDPLVHDLISARTYSSMGQASAAIMQNAQQFHLPLLLMHGGDDHMTSCRASAAFADKIGTNCNYKQWEKLYHELHNELDNQMVVTHILNWLKELL